MTDDRNQPEALASFNSRWVLLSGILIVTASIALLRLSAASASFFLMACAAAFQFGYFPKHIYLLGQAERRFHMAVRVRWIAMATGVLVAIAVSGGNLDPMRLMIIGGGALWLGSVNLLVSILARQRSIPTMMLLYVYYIADFWLALSLVILGTNWLIVTGLLCLAAVNALVLNAEGDTRLPALVAISAVGLLIAGIPPQARGFSVYLSAPVIIAVLGSALLTRTALQLRAAAMVSASGAAGSHS